MSRGPSKPLKRSTSDPRPPSGFAIEPIALREEDACLALGISQPQLAALRKRGVVPFAKLGERIVYPVSVLRRFMDGIAQGPSVPAVVEGD